VGEKQLAVDEGGDPLQRRSEALVPLELVDAAVGLSEGSVACLGEAEQQRFTIGNVWPAALSGIQKLCQTSRIGHRVPRSCGRHSLLSVALDIRGATPTD